MWKSTRTTQIQTSTFVENGRNAIAVPRILAKNRGRRKIMNIKQWINISVYSSISCEINTNPINSNKVFKDLKRIYKLENGSSIRNWKRWKKKSPKLLKLELKLANNLSKSYLPQNRRYSPHLYLPPLWSWPLNSCLKWTVKMKRVLC